MKTVRDVCNGPTPSGSQHIVPVLRCLRSDHICMSAGQERSLKFCIGSSNPDMGHNKVICAFAEDEDGDNWDPKEECHEKMEENAYDGWYSCSTSVFGGELTGWHVPLAMRRCFAPDCG